MTTRRHVHTRNIRADMYARDDGLWDIEAELIDTKARDFQLATGMRRAGDPIHRMRLTITIDTRMNVIDARTEMLAVPYAGYCVAIEPDYQRLIGLNLLKNFRNDVRERLGGTDGCTHITELTGVLPTAAVQAFAGEVFATRDATRRRRCRFGGAREEALPDRPLPCVEERRTRGRRVLSALVSRA